MAAAAFVVDGGLAIVTNLVSGIGGTVPKYVAWGTGSTTATQTDTGLQTASSEARTSGTVSRTTTSTTNDTYQVVGTITSTQTQTIQEVALYDASTAGNCFLHATHGAQALVSGDSIQYTITAEFTN